MKLPIYFDVWLRPIHQDGWVTRLYVLSPDETAVIAQQSVCFSRREIRTLRPGLRDIYPLNWRRGHEAVANKYIIATRKLKITCGKLGFKIGNGG